MYRYGHLLQNEQFGMHKLFRMSSVQHKHFYTTFLDNISLTYMVTSWSNDGQPLANVKV